MIKFNYKIISLFVYLFAILSCIYYKIYISCSLFEISIPFVVSYFIIDTYNATEMQYRIHHICGLNLFIYTIYYRIPLDEVGIFIYTIFKTELSSVFLLFMPMLEPNSYLFHANNVMFCLSFTKTRIIDMYYGLITPESGLYIIVDKYTPENKLVSVSLIASCYVLYGLNLYWFSIILRHIYSAVIHLLKQNKQLP